MDKLLRHSLTKKRAIHAFSSIESWLWLKALVGFHSLCQPPTPVSRPRARCCVVVMVMGDDVMVSNANYMAFSGCHWTP